MGGLITALHVGSALLEKGAPCEFLYYGLDFMFPLTKVQSYSPSIAGSHLMGQIACQEIDRKIEAFLTSICTGVTTVDF